MDLLKKPGEKKLGVYILPTLFESIKFFTQTPIWYDFLSACLLIPEMQIFKPASNKLHEAFIQNEDHILHDS